LQYAQKVFVFKSRDNQHPVVQQMWESIHANDKKGVYRHIVCSGIDVNAIHGQASFSTSLTMVNVVGRAGKP
jgi:Arf-GAP/coiled-coil/ANK repeat/PH domain-containing protein